MLTGSEGGLEPGELVTTVSTVTRLTPAKHAVTPVMSTIRLVCPDPCSASQTRLARPGCVVKTSAEGNVVNHCNFVQNIRDNAVATNLFEYFEDDELLPCDRF